MPIRAENRKKREMETYLVQIQYKLPSRKVCLVSHTVEAWNNWHAYEMVKVMSSDRGEVIGAYVTGDPYKIMRFGTGE
jgi:hypothetical protein